MPLNTQENASSVIQSLLEIARSGRDADSLLGQIGLSDRELRLVTRSLSRTLRSLQEIAGLQNRVEETILRIQGTSGAEQRRLARLEASRNESRARSDMRYVDLLGRFGLRPDAQGNLFEASRRDYLTQKYYSQFAEFNDEGFVSNRQEATRTARTLADAQIRQENIEANNSLQEGATRKQHARRAQNLSARESYRDSLRSIQDPNHMRRKALYEQFLQVDEISGKSSLDQRKAAAKKASDVLAAEKANTKGVNENTKALFSLRSFLGPYAKLAMPFYAAKLLYQTGAASTDASLERVRRRTFGGLYGASLDRRGYRRMFNAMTSYGASEEDVLREYSGQKKWASTLMFGIGLDKIEALAMVLGKAPGPAEMRDPELMQRWLRENMRGITDMQAMQLSAMGVASDTFIESARKGQAVDIEGKTATARETYNVLGKQTGNPIKKLGYKIAANQAYISEAAASGNAGKMLQIGALGSNYGMYAQALESERIRENNYNESKELIPQQTNITVNINGNIDSEERAHSFAEQIAHAVPTKEK